MADHVTRGRGVAVVRFDGQHIVIGAIAANPNDTGQAFARVDAVQARAIAEDILRHAEMLDGRPVASDPMKH